MLSTSLFEKKQLSEMTLMKSGETITAKRISDMGKYPCYGGNGLRGYTDRFTHDGEYVLVGRQGALCGNVTYVNGKFYASEHAIVVTVKNTAMPKFLFYLLNDMKLNQYSESSAQPGLSVNKILALETYCPSIEEQQAIAEVLTDTDNLISSLQRLIDKKKAVKQGAMEELLTGKRRLPGFNGEWVERKLGDISLIKTGNKNVDNASLYGKYPFFVRSHIVYKIDTYSFDGEAILIPGEGGIGDIFHYINGKFDYHQRVYKISNFTDDISGKYIYYYLKSFFKKYALSNTAKATVDSLRLPTFLEFKIKLPRKIQEQEAIARVLSDMDSEINELEKKLSKYEKIKQGMMQQLLTGRIRLLD